MIKSKMFQNLQKRIQAMAAYCIFRKLSPFPNIYLPTIITLASAEAKSGLGVADHPGQQRCSRHQPRLQPLVECSHANNVRQTLRSRSSEALA
ncbi:MAG: hypothetical protein SFW63_03765 [Alphaproteobacteria bacterium]|nr:hypothetical protein [Alphaproteobacteria bacterium]